MRLKPLHLLSWIILSFVISLQWSCTTDTTEKEQPEKKFSYNQVVGEWVITEAHKGGKKTGMLEGAYFKFQPENKMSTNLTGAEITYDIQVDKNVIQQKGNVEIHYTVESIQDTIMVLTFNMRGYPFKLNLTKS